MRFEAVEATLFNNSLSPDGAFAASQTADTPNEDGNQLFVFDLAKGELMTRFSPEIGWADSYKFDARAKTIRLRQRDGGEFAFGFDGSFIDREAWIEHGLAAAKPMILETLLREAGGKIDAALALPLRWNDGLIRAVAAPNLHPSSKASLLRYSAEGYEDHGDAAAALAAYEAAVQDRSQDGRQAQDRPTPGPAAVLSAEAYILTRPDRSVPAQTPDHWP